MISSVVGKIRRLLYEIYKFLSVSHNPILFRLKYFLPISIKAMWFFKKRSVGKNSMEILKNISCILFLKTLLCHH